MADVCHEEWVKWSRNISNELTLAINTLKKDIELLEENGMENKGAIELVQKLESRLERWGALWISYEELSEEMKDADRKYAIKMYEIAKKGLKD